MAFRLPLPLLCAFVCACTVPVVRADVTFADPTAVGTCGYVLDSDLVDLNGDGHLDLLTVRGQSLVRRLGDGEGGFGSPRAFLGAVGLERFAVTDFNDDGLADVVANSIQGRFAAVFIGTPEGAFEPAQLVSTNDGEGFSVLVGDFDGNGTQDFVTQSYSAIVRFFPGDGTGTFGDSLAATQLPSRRVAGDFDQDGKTEIAVVEILGGPLSRSTISIFEANDDGVFVRENAFLVGRGPRELRAADFNGDGRVDLLAVDLDRRIYLLPGRAAGGFKSPIVTEPVQADRVLQIADLTDFDNDGDVDLLFRETSLQGATGFFVHVLESDGRFRRGTYESFAPQTIRFPHTLTLTAVAAGSVDGDGRPDVVFAAPLEGELIAAFSR